MVDMRWLILRNRNGENLNYCDRLSLWKQQDQSGNNIMINIIMQLGTHGADKDVNQNQYMQLGMGMGMKGCLFNL